MRRQEAEYGIKRGRGVAREDSALAASLGIGSILPLLETYLSIPYIKRQG